MEFSFPGPVARYCMKWFGSIAAVFIALGIAGVIQNTLVIRQVGLTVGLIALGLFTCVIICSALEYNQRH